VIEHTLKCKWREPTIAYGLGHLNTAALPRLAAAYDAATTPETRAKLGFAVMLLLARLGAAGETWPAEYDRRIDASEDVNGARYVLRNAMQALPVARARPQLLRLLAERTTAMDLALLAWGVAVHAGDPAIRDAFVARLIAQAEELKGSEINEALSGGLCAIAEPEPIVRAVLAGGAGVYLGKMLAEMVGNERYAQIVAEAGTGDATSDDPIGRAIAFAARVTGDDAETVFALRVIDEPPRSFERVGGLPPGIGADAWPHHEDDPMVHLFTLEFLDPATSLVANTLSVFCARPDLNYANEPRTDWSAVVYQTAAEAARPSVAPDDVTVMAVKRIERVPISVPAAVWSARSGPEGRLRDALYQLPARLGGRPQWLQSPDDEANEDDFILQFDADFIPMNLGDSGVMYVFAETAFWQCH
jgi:hypothetical protein